MENQELMLLGLPPASTVNPARATEIAAEIMSSEATFSNPGEPNNSTKMRHIRDVFDTPAATLHDLFGYAGTFIGKNPARHQGGAFLADLRCQYIKRVIEEGLIGDLLGWMLYTRNRIWYVRLREQLGLAIQANERSERGDECNA